MNVLIVDPDQNTVMGMGALLQNLGHCVATTENTDEAVSLVCELATDVVVTEYLRTSDGRLLAERLRAAPACGHVPVLVFTANAIDAKSHVLSAEATYLPKPTPP